jgi:hypothetical protein
MATPRKANPKPLVVRKPYSQQDLANMNAYLQRTQAEIEAHQGLKSLRPYQTPTNDRPLDDQSRTRGYRKPFRHHSLIVQEKATEWLSSLMIKHKAKLDKLRAEHRTSAANLYYGVLVATATQMAKRDLGLLPPFSEAQKKGRYRRNTRSAMKVKLGIKDQDFSRKPKPPAPCSITQGNLEGI